MMGLIKFITHFRYSFDKISTKFNYHTTGSQVTGEILSNNLHDFHLNNAKKLEQRDKREENAWGLYTKKEKKEKREMGRASIVQGLACRCHLFDSQSLMSRPLDNLVAQVLPKFAESNPLLSIIFCDCSFVTQ